VAVVCDDQEKLTLPQLFDQVITVDLSRFEEDEKLVFNKATICMYEHSPYTYTIKLDADMIWLNGRDPMQLFDQLEAFDLMHQNRGHGWNAGNSVWTDEEKLKEAYGFTGEEKLYKIYGEFVYFKKTALSKKYFSLVKKIFGKPKVEMTSGFANGSFTDELAYQIACMQMGLEQVDNFTPVMNKYLGYYQYHHVFAYQLPASFFAYSIGGNSTPSFMKEQYNILANHYYHQLGLQNPYQVRNKKSFLPERKKR
jgi:hypothetical protein